MVDVLHSVDSVLVYTTVIDSNQISVSWMTPQSIIDQGVSQYQIVVTPLCSAQGMTGTQRFTTTPPAPSSITISTLGKLKLI